MDQLKLQVDVSTELNEFGKNEIRITSNKDNSFQLRIGYWERLDYNIIKKLQDKFHIHISEELFEDEDCGDLYGYTCYWELPNDEINVGLPTDDELEEMEFLHKYESDELDYLDWVVDNKIDIG
tara:strand:+ start:22 stop:393 length:372 start_codon:yes stop_codon:yes gene_type:complete